MGMDPQQLSAISGIPAARRQSGRIQRKIHGESDGFARWFLCNAALAHSLKLPKFFLSARSLAVQRISAGAIGLRAPVRLHTTRFIYFQAFRFARAGRSN